MVERLIVALTKDGYIKPINIFVKVLPDLDQGAKIVGFMNEIMDQSFL